MSILGVAAWLKQDRLFKRRQFSWRLEPVIDLLSGAQVGEELLIRGSFPRNDLDWSVWHRALARRIIPQHAFAGWLSINLHTVHLLSRRAGHWLAPLQGLPLVLEWTEKLGTPEQVKAAGARLRWLRRQYGFRISLDDMGAGQDARQRFAVTEPDFGKIDGHLFQQARHDSGVRKAIGRLTRLCQQEDVPVVAEWIETEDDRLMALSLGATHGQGHFWPGRTLEEN